MVARITREELKAQIDAGEDVVIVEALPERYYLDRHLPGALNLPHDEVDARAPELLPSRSANIVVYCASGPCRNSGLAAERLVELGYDSVRDYHEGKEDWIDAGLPVETGDPCK